MNASTAPMPEAPFFHEASEQVRFWILVEEEWVGASVSKQALRMRYQRNPLLNAPNEDPLVTYLAHAPEMEAAVRRRLLGGALKPVMLRERDLQTPA
jgi:hypothetical protein